MKPEITLALVSLVVNKTVARPGLFPPSIMVLAAPPELVTVIALPLKSMFS